MFCPVCGNALVTPDACDACRTPSREFPWPTSLPTGADEVRYDLSDFEPIHRALITDHLRDVSIPYRFESGIVLVVAATDEDRVDETLAEVEAPDEEDLALAAAGDEEEVEADEEAMDALYLLHDAADRLTRHPDGSHVADEFEAAAAIVTASEPPWAFDAKLWGRIGDAAKAVRGHLDAGSLGEVMLAAEELRDLTRDHV
jgi:hypothetical protein